MTSNMTREEDWLQENVTGLVYHKELTADKSYLFAVTAWNRWGESLLERNKMLSITTDFQAKTIKKMGKKSFYICKSLIAYVFSSYPRVSERP